MNTTTEAIALDILTNFFAGNEQIAKKVLDAQKKPEAIQ